MASSSSSSSLSSLVSLASYLNPSALSSSILLSPYRSSESKFKFSPTFSSFPLPRPAMPTTLPTLITLPTPLLIPLLTTHGKKRKAMHSPRCDSSITPLLPLSWTIPTVTTPIINPPVIIQTLQTPETIDTLPQPSKPKRSKKNATKKQNKSNPSSTKYSQSEIKRRAQILGLNPMWVSPSSNYPVASHYTSCDPSPNNGQIYDHRSVDAKYFHLSLFFLFCFLFCFLLFCFASFFMFWFGFCLVLCLLFFLCFVFRSFFFFTFLFCVCVFCFCFFFWFAFLCLCLCSAGLGWKKGIMTSTYLFVVQNVLVTWTVENWINLVILVTTVIVVILVIAMTTRYLRTLFLVDLLVTSEVAQ